MHHPLIQANGRWAVDEWTIRAIPSPLLKKFSQLDDYLFGIIRTLPARQILHKITVSWKLFRLEQRVGQIHDFIPRPGILLKGRDLVFGWRIPAFFVLVWISLM